VTQGERILVMASGAGTILKALIDSGLPVAAVVTDRQCKAEEIAESKRIRCVRVLRDNYGETFDRESYTDELLHALLDVNPDLIAMAGFGTVLSKEFMSCFYNRVLNTHPSLLPLFKGWHAVRDALAADAKVTGCTVHIATDKLDEGPILFQQAVPILPGDSEESLHARIKEAERKIYPKVIGKFIDSGFSVQPITIDVE